MVKTTKDFNHALPGLKAQLAMCLVFPGHCFCFSLFMCTLAPKDSRPRWGVVYSEEGGVGCTLMQPSLYRMVGDYIPWGFRQDRLLLELSHYLVPVSYLRWDAYVGEEKGWVSLVSASEARVCSSVSEYLCHLSVDVFSRNRENCPDDVSWLELLLPSPVCFHESLTPDLTAET